MFNSPSEFKNSTKIAYDALKANNKLKISEFRALLAKSTPFGTLAAYMASFYKEDPLKSLSEPIAQDRLVLSTLTNLFIYNDLTILIESDDYKGETDIVSDGISVIIYDTHFKVNFRYHLRSGKLKHVEHVFELARLTDYKLNDGVFTFISDTDEAVRIAFTSKAFLYGNHKKQQTHKSFIEVKCIDLSDEHAIEHFVFINESGIYVRDAKNSLKKATDLFVKYIHVLVGHPNSGTLSFEEKEEIIEKGELIHDGRKLTLTMID